MPVTRFCSSEEQVPNVSLAKLDFVESVSLKSIGNNGLQIHLHVEKVDNINLGASVSGSGIGCIKNIDIVQKHDPEIAMALTNASDIKEIAAKVDELTSLLANYYQGDIEPKDNTVKKIKENTETIKMIIETIKYAAPAGKILYNLIAAKFNLHPWL